MEADDFKDTALPTSDSETWSVAHLKEYLDALITTNDRMYQQRYDSTKDALALALESIDKRLSTMNEFRAALNDQTTRMLTREEYDSRHTALGAKIELGLANVDEKMTDNIRLVESKTDGLIRLLESKTDDLIEPIIEKVDQFGKPNWTLITSFLSIAGLSIAGIWLVLGLKIDNSSVPLSLAIEQVKTRFAAYDTSIIDQKANRDRQVAELVVNQNHLSEQVSSNAQAISTIGALQQARIHAVDGLAEHINSLESDLKTTSAVTNAKLTEIETQLKSVSVVINIAKDDTNQMVGLLWKKVFNQELPPKPYRPDLYER